MGYIAITEFLAFTSTYINGEGVSGMIETELVPL